MKWTLMAIFFLTIPALAHGTTYYVATTGSDSNSGTQTKPFKTIQKAANVVVAGDSVSVASGTYNISNTDTGTSEYAIQTTTSGTSGAHIKFFSAMPLGAKIVTSGVRRVWWNGNSGSTQGSYMEITGFDMSGDGAIGIANYGSNVLMSGNYIHDITLANTSVSCDQYGGAGILQTNATPPTNNTITGNKIVRLGLSCNVNPGAHNVYFGYGTGSITNNILADAKHAGIQLYPSPTNVLVANNTIVGNNTTGITSYCTSCTIKNNIFYANQYGIYEPSGNGNTYLNNLVYATANSPAIDIRTNSTINGTIIKDPQFVNYKADGTGDYSLQPTSPAVNVGSAIPSITTDFSGVSRPQGGIIDIGAYEYSYSPLLPPTNITISQVP